MSRMSPAASSMAWPPTSLRRTGRKSKRPAKPLSQNSTPPRDARAFRRNRICWRPSSPELTNCSQKPRGGSTCRWLGQIESGKEFPEEILPETALFGSGRPVLVVPYIQKAGMKLDRVLVCWDGSRAAARAIGDAMPFLARSKSIDIVTIARNEEPRDEMPGVDIAQHLARHKLKVEFKRIVAKDPDVASIILSTAADLGSDMIVMGGYGHSRLREFVLGGATRGILEAMTVPVLMSH